MADLSTNREATIQSAMRTIRGQGSGLSWNYFRMLSGSEDAARGACHCQSQGTAEVSARLAPGLTKLTLITAGAYKEGVGFQLPVLHQPTAHAGQVLGGFHRGVSSPAGRVSFRR